MTTVMRAEWRKITALPLPRWTLLAFLVCTLGGGFAALKAADGTPATVAGNAQIGLVVAGTVATVAFAVWVFGLEASSGTYARVFLAEPRRGRVLAAKSLLAVGLPALVVTVAAALTLPLAAAAVNAHGGHADLAALARQFAASVTQVVLVAPIAAGFAVLTRSMAGGAIATLALLLLAPGVFAATGLNFASPTLALQALHDQIAGTDAGFAITGRFDIAPLTALLSVAAWSAALLLTGLVRLARMDVR